MTRVQASDSNAYDVLGVSPKASAEEIDAAFHQLIEGGDYRVGVPLRGQWLRAHQIKEAYATLGDPAKRRAYDESLKGGSERPLWPAIPHNDPAEAALVRPLSEWQPPPEPTPKLIPDALGSGDGERELAPAVAIEPANDEIVPDADQPATSPDDFSRNEVKYGSAKLWGTAAAATLAIGGLFYFTWPSGQQQLPASEMAAQPQQVDSGAPTTGRLANLPPVVAPDGLVSEGKPGAAGDASPAADGLTISVDAAGASETAVPGAAATEVASANETQTGSVGAAASGGTAASATAPAPAPSSAGQTSSPAEAAVAATPAPAPVSPRAQATTSEAVRPGAGIVRSPAQLIGGGPTRLDNPRGRHVGTVVVQFTVQADGRVSNCGPVRSSGKAGLDALTCHLVEERMRFNPARDGQGNPVASTAHARYEWGRRRRHPSLLSWIFR